MIEKMKFLSITGPRDDIDRVIDTYLDHHEIQLESALTELRTVPNLVPLTDIDPYKDVYSQAENIYPSISDKTISKDRKLTLEESSAIVSALNKQLVSYHDAKDKLNVKLEEYKEKLDKIDEFIGLNYSLDSILHFKHVKFRFGRFTKEYYKKFIDYVYDDTDSIFYKCTEDDTYVNGVCFTTPESEEKVDAVYSSMHYERLWVPDEYEGTPSEASQLLKDKIAKIEASLKGVDDKIDALISSSRDDFLIAYSKLKDHAENYDIRRMAACTQNDGKNFYILCGWMKDKEAKSLQEELSNDDYAFCIVEKDHSNLTSNPPTKLKNPALFRPYEMYVEMYGLPNYKELDPTILIALTYSLFFGFMFGDVGQGLLLLIGGAILASVKKSRLAGIISRCGFFSVIFGFLYGSFFGFEDVIPALWLRPSEATTTIPFIGTLNTVFIVAVGIGMAVILMMMLLNIINKLKMNDRTDALFDTNGVAGFVFYLSAVIIICLFMTSKPLPASILLIILFGLPLIFILFKEPLGSLISHHKTTEKTGIGMFLVQGFFELFEVLLSYFSNTLSFVRVGAFAVSHAAMMGVVLMLSGAQSGTSINWVVVVLGNLFVCGMEGLIVGIQVLRLEYYELFSRFYKGDGRTFSPNNHRI